MSAKSLAAIAIFAYNRTDCLLKTLSALRQCKEAEHSVIYFFLDGPKPHLPEDEENIKQVSDIAKSAKIAKLTTIYQKEANQGLRKSITDGVTQLLNDHDKVIVLEDDIIVSRTFLAYMNHHLNLFEKEERIFQVCGYMVPTSMRLPDYGFLRVGTCWGWGTWKRAWQHYEDDAKKLTTSFSVEKAKYFDLDGYCTNFEDLKANAEGTLNTWAVRWDASILLKGGMSLLPGKSLTRNIGFGPNSTNCNLSTVSRTLMSQSISRRCPVVTKKYIVTETPSFVQAVQNFNVWQSKTWGQSSQKRSILKRLITIIKLRS